MFPLNHKAFEFARLFSFSAGPPFSRENFAPGWPESDDLQLGQPHSIPRFGLMFLAAARIHNEASMRATMRRGGTSTFFDQLDFMPR
jgi:hypothetical protein